MKKITYILIFSLLLSALPVSANQTSFADISGHWAESSINSAVNMGLISGLPDGRFDPDSSITLGEVLAMLVPVVTGERPEISDSEDWYRPYVKKAFECGIFAGFTPEELEGFYGTPAMRMLVNVLFSNTLESLELVKKPFNTREALKKATLGLKYFADSDELFNDIYIISAYNCVSHGIVRGNEKFCLMPFSYMTRAEAVTMLLRLKSYQTQRINGLHYTDPYSYYDYYFTCVKSPDGLVLPVKNTESPIVTEDGTVYMTVGGIVKILEIAKGNYDTTLSSENDVYTKFYDKYITVPSDANYSFKISDDSLYGYSDSYTGYILSEEGKRFRFECSPKTSSSPVIRNLPMLPVEEVLNFFEISFGSVVLDDSKASIVVDFTLK